MTVLRTPALRRPLRPSPWIDRLALALLLAGLCLALVHAAGQLGYNWQWYRLPRYFLTADGLPGPLLLGLGQTLWYSGAGLLLAAVVGLFTALLRLSDSALLRGAARLQLEIIRNTPLLLQILVAYFVVAPRLGLSRPAAGLLALALFEGAYASETIRAGILAVPAGQWDAAHSLGLSAAQTYGRVVLPQALRQMLPALASQGVSLVKDSSLLSAISIYELTMQGKLVVADTFLAFEVWFAVAALYLGLNLGLSRLSALLEQRLAPC